MAGKPDLTKNKRLTNLFPTQRSNDIEAQEHTNTTTHEHKDAEQEQPGLYAEEHRNVHTQEHTSSLMQEHTNAPAQKHTDTTETAHRRSGAKDQVRKQFLITEELEDRLKYYCYRRRIRETEVVRQALDLFLHGEGF
jgi:hypothetical protein